MLWLVCLMAPCLAADGDREAAVRNDKARVEAEGYWLYNDLPEAFRQAKQTGRPIIVVLRCLPCDECVQLDDELVNEDPKLRRLLDQFVRVRVVGTNGLDLNVFQYDTDQSFAVFLLNADKTIYGRFGTRSHRTEWLGDVSLEGMARALEATLKLHADYPANRAALAGKTGAPIEFDQPQKYPSLSDRPAKLDYEGNVVKSCIHCHQIGEARRDYYWKRGEPIPEKIMRPYPHPKSLGLILDPRYPARVKQVTPDSIASKAGFKTGDDLLTMQGQPLVSMADVQWVLHHSDPNGVDVVCDVLRDGERKSVTLRLGKDWRKLDDPFWRVASWSTRRVANGGMRLIPLKTDERKRLGIENGMALRVLSLGRHGPHGTALKKGLRKDDVLIRMDGRDDFENEAAWFDHVVSTKKRGDKVELQAIRGKKRLSFSIPIQP